MKLELNMETLKALLPVLKQAQPAIYGLALVGIFGYTAFFINQSLNVKPSEEQTAIQALPKVVFDKNTISTLKNLNPVGGEVPLGNLGSSDPFR